ncbi:family 1 glycosylhydrolase, partial [Bacillus sp. WP8]|uniref:family 1 glycosylhydrolase n=1 Tax=Bacillus sp. WP8 TaxID=756828 RepID=UPI0021B18C96
MDEEEIEEGMGGDRGEGYGKGRGVEFYDGYGEDMGLLKEMGLKRLGVWIGWRGIFGKGDEEEGNEGGLLFYDGL